MLSRSISAPFALLALAVAAAVSASPMVERGEPPACKPYLDEDWKGLKLVPLTAGAASTSTKGVFTARTGQTATYDRGSKKLYLKGAGEDGLDWTLFVFTLGAYDYAYEVEGSHDCTTDFPLSTSDLAYKIRLYYEQA